MMAVLKDCVELIQRYYGKQVDIAQIPHDDPKVYKSLQVADTIGLFHVESRAQMASLPRNNPDKFYDLVVQVAIIRPGLIVGQMMNPYTERRQGAPRLTMDRTEATLRKLFAALPAPGYDIGVLSDGAMYRVEAAPVSRILRMLPYLKYNANRRTHLAAPHRESPYTLLDGTVHGSRATARSSASIQTDPEHGDGR